MVVVNNGLNTRPISKRYVSERQCKLIGISGSSSLLTIIFKAGTFKPMD